MLIRKIFTESVRISLIVTSIALIGAAVAPYADPLEYELIPFLGLMYPFLLLLHLILFVCYFVIKRNKLSLLFLLPVLTTVNIFLNSFGLNYAGSKKEEDYAGTLKFMTYNVHMFQDANVYNKSVQSEILKIIRHEQPEILCMQDFISTKTKGLKTIDSIGYILKTKHYYSGPGNKKIFPTQSIATVSKYPIVNTGFILLSETSIGNQAIFTDINKNGKIIRIYNVHFESLGFQPYQYEEWRNSNILGKLKFLLKVKDKFSVAFANRSEQVKLVKKHAETCPYPFIIAGDFNDTPSSFAVNYTMKGMKNTFREKGRGYTVTFNGGLPDFQIDYIMVNRSFKVLDYNVIRKQLSDHYPVIAKIILE